MRTTFRSTILALALIAVGQSRDVQAQLLVYEGFDYTPGVSIATLAGGSGWGANAWLNSTANRGATNLAGSLGYTDSFGHSLLTTGGRLDVGFLSGTTANAERSMGATYSSGTYWLSFLANRVGPVEPGGPTNYARQAALALFNGTGERLDVGRPNTANFNGTPYDTWTMWTNTGTATPTTTTRNLNAPDGSLLLLRLDLDPGNGLDTVRLWLNPGDITVEPVLGTEDALLSTSAAGLDLAFNRLRLNANGGNTAGGYAELLIDEFRLGGSFPSVVPLAPEPGTLSILFLGLLAVAKLRRRRNS